MALGPQSNSTSSDQCKKRRRTGKSKSSGTTVETHKSSNGTPARKLMKKHKKKPQLDSTESADGKGRCDAETPCSSSSSTSFFRSNTSFTKLGLTRWLAETCSKLGMNYPTEVQAMCIPPVLNGKNVVGNAKTGSGKTACYCLPILHHLSKDPYGVFALVLLPVRELVFQVSENFAALGKGIKVQLGEIVGGRDMLLQSKMIYDRKHILIATPGRLADLLRGDDALAKAFFRLRFLVIDEADRLLTQTFEEPLSEILPILPKARQTLLFSATITHSIEKLKLKFSSEKEKELHLVDANPQDASLDTLTQQYIFVPKVAQICYLHYLLKEHFPDESCIVFAATIELCQLITTMFEFMKFSVTGLHSLHSQRQRLASLNKFRAGRSKILIATDVAGRGLDIPKVAVVINMGLPLEVDDYIHRAGRTARAGRPGLVVSIMTERDVPRIKAIEDRVGHQLALRETSEEDAVKLLSKTTKVRQQAELLLAEVGFEDRAREHRESRPGARGSSESHQENNTKASHRIRPGKRQRAKVRAASATPVTRDRKRKSIE